MTGALEVPMSKAEAKKITGSIRRLLTQIANSTDKLFDQIEQAKAGDAWKILEYPSWPAYVAAEFGDALKRLDRADRLPAVVKLRELGMSTRVIGKVTGVSEGTVRNDLDRSGAQNYAPDSPVTGTDGKTYKPARVLPSGNIDAATVEAMGRAVPPARSGDRRSSVQRFEAAAARVVALGYEVTEGPRFPVADVRHALDSAIRNLTALRALVDEAAGGADDV